MLLQTITAEIRLLQTAIWIGLFLAFGWAPPHRVETLPESSPPSPLRVAAAAGEAVPPAPLPWK